MMMKSLRESKFKKEQSEKRKIENKNYLLVGLILLLTPPLPYTRVVPVQTLNKGGDYVSHPHCDTEANSSLLMLREMITTSSHTVNLDRS